MDWTNLIVKNNLSLFLYICIPPLESFSKNLSLSIVNKFLP